jgi:hypothetical protein
VPSAAGRNAELLLSSGGLREEQAGSNRVTFLLKALQRFWLPPVVSGHKVRGPGRPLSEKRSVIQRKLAPSGFCWRKKLP